MTNSPRNPWMVLVLLGLSACSTKEIVVDLPEVRTDAGDMQVYLAPAADSYAAWQAGSAHRRYRLSIDGETWSSTVDELQDGSGAGFGFRPGGTCRVTLAVADGGPIVL